MMAIDSSITFEESFQAWLKNRVYITERKKPDNNYATGNLNALKVTEEQIEFVISEMQNGSTVAEIHKTYFDDVCTLAAIKSRIRKYYQRYGKNI